MVLFIVGGMVFRQALKPPVPVLLVIDQAGAAPSAFGDSANSVAIALATPPEVSDQGCEDPGTRCANNCRVMPADVGRCDWSVVSGSTQTPDEAVKTFAAALQKVQAEGTKTDEVDQAYLLDQFVKFYKKSMTENERKSFQGLKAATQDPFEQKALDVLLDK